MGEKSALWPAFYWGWVLDEDEFGGESEVDYVEKLVDEKYKDVPGGVEAAVAGYALSRGATVGAEEAFRTWFPGVA